MTRSQLLLALFVLSPSWIVVAETPVTSLSCVEASVLGATVECLQRATVQEPDELKKEFEARKAKLRRNDVDGHYDLALWCEQVGLKREAQTVLRTILREDPDHEGARKLMGYVKFDGEWVREADLDKLKEKKQEEEYKAKGYVKYKGEWVPKDHVPYLKRGLRWYDEEWISEADFNKIEEGWIRFEGEMFPPDAKAKLDQGLFPVEGAWVTEEQADFYHAKWETPWVIRRDKFRFRSTQKRAHILQEALPIAKEGYGYARLILRQEPTDPLDLYYFATTEQYNAFSDRYAGAESSIYGAYYCPREEHRPGVLVYNANWWRYYVRYAVARAYLHRVVADGVEIPEWFATGVGIYADRFAEKSLRQWFYNNMVKGRGGLKPFETFFEKFELTPEDHDGSTLNLNQSGLLVAYFVDGGNAKHTELFREAVDALLTGKKVERAFHELERRAKEYDAPVPAFAER